MKATWTKYYFENGVVIECRKLDANEKRDAINKNGAIVKQEKFKV